MGSHSYGCTPSAEQLWRTEVLYLHSLWHNGPPQNPNPKSSSNNLCAFNTTTFKVEKKKRKKRSAKKKKDSNPPLVPYVEWPCEPTLLPCTETILVGSNPQFVPPSVLASVKEQATTSKKKKKGRNAKKKRDSNPPIVLDVEWPCEPTSEPCNETGMPDSNPQFVPPSVLASVEGQATTSKKKKKRRNAKKKRNSNPPIVTNVEWPCEPTLVPCSETGWPNSNPPSTSPPISASFEEQAKVIALELQQSSLKACRDFLSNKVCSNNEGEDEEEEDLMDDDIIESEDLKFFLGIFMEDNDLRSYYEKNCEGGEFCCLVCSGIGKRVGKRFKNCVALVQHSTAISKTRRKRAHRAFGQAICRVLGWDIHRLPSIVLTLDEPLSHSRVKAEPKVDPKETSNGPQNEYLQHNFIDLVDDDDSELDLREKGDSDQKEGHQNKVVDSVNANKDKPMDWQIKVKEWIARCSREDAAGNREEDLQEGIVDSVRTNKGKSVVDA